MSALTPHAIKQLMVRVRARFREIDHADWDPHHGRCHTPDTQKWEQATADVLRTTPGVHPAEWLEIVRILSMTALDVLTLMAALSLAGVAAYLSVNGFVVLFPGLPIAALWLGCSPEFAKLCSAGWLGHRWRDVSWLSRIALIAFTLAAAISEGLLSFMFRFFRFVSVSRQ